MKIRTDSLLHLETCALLCIIFALLLSWWGAAIAALSIGIGKEIWDRYHGGVPSWSDVFWDVVGVATGTIIIII